MAQTLTAASMVDDLLEKIEQRTYRVGIVGLGYVGLPLMWIFHEKQMPVIGFDIDESKVRHIEE